MYNVAAEGSPTNRIQLIDLVRESSNRNPVLGNVIDFDGIAVFGLLFVSNYRCHKTRYKYKSIKLVDLAECNNVSFSFL